MGKDYVLINISDADGNSRVYLEPYKELFEKLDSHDAEYEYEHWKIDGDYLDLGSELHDIKIVMIRTIYANYGGCTRVVNKIYV